MEYLLDIGPPLVEGKTKILFESKSDPYAGYARNKDVVTWKDKFSRPMSGKGGWSTTVNDRMFGLFGSVGIPVAYLGLVDETTFKTELCDMFPFEVVACCIVDADSSFRKRNPKFPAGTRFTEPFVQFHLKTSGRKYLDWQLPCDDPLMVVGNENVGIYLPGEPIEKQEPIFTVPLGNAAKVFPGFERMGEMKLLTARSARAARSAYQAVDADFFDGKWEYGRALRPSLQGKTLSTDVFDADSMRVTKGGEHADKQPIRNGGEAAFDLQVAAYKLAVEISKSIKY